MSHAMPEDFFDLPQQQPGFRGFLSKPILDRMERPYASRAAAALRSFRHACMTQTTFEALRGGQIIVPLSALGHLANIHAKGEVPFDMISIHDGLRATASLVVFTDRSGLIALHVEIPEAPGVEFLRVHPVPLAIAPTARFTGDREAVDVACEALPDGSGARVILKRVVARSRKGKSHEVLGALEDLVYSTDVGHAVLNDLKEAIRKWAVVARRAPDLAEPASGASGGYSPSWPASFPCANFDAESFPRYDAFMRLAYAAIFDRYARRCQQGALVVEAAMPTGSRPPGRLHVKTVAYVGQERDREIERQMQADFGTMLDHPSAPAGCLELCMSQEVFADPDCTRTKLTPVAVFRGIFSEDRPTAHDMIQAIRLFGRSR